jgi:hypothetical protein
METMWGSRGMVGGSGSAVMAGLSYPVGRCPDYVRFIGIITKIE